MPANSLIVGIDLVPIKAIPRVITIQGDITADRCRSNIGQHLKTWKADTVLHDGAPNVGAAWLQDAFTQAELTLKSLKLATEFLVEGGTFVTKVFRSRDYNSLLWVFNQLFAKVEATKPPSSRSVSAEIYVVCRGFKAPKRIDPKFLDARSVFAELAEPTPNNEAKVFKPEIKKRKREGYSEGDYTQFKEISVTEFIQTIDPIAMLASYNRLTLEQSSNGDVALAAVQRLPETTQEIRQCCTDLKVLGRRDFRALLKWRLLVRDKFGLGPKKSDAETAEAEETVNVSPLDDELHVQEELQKLSEKGTARQKRQRRRDNEQKQKEIVRMQLNMTAPMDIGLEQSGPEGADATFSLKPLARAGAVRKIARGRMTMVSEAGGPRADPGRKADDPSDGESSDDPEDGLERELDAMYENYQTRRAEVDARYRAKRAREERRDDEWDGIQQSDARDSSDENLVEESEDEDSEASDGSERQAMLMNDDLTKVSAKTRLSRRAELFFEQDIFKSIDGLEDEGEDAEDKGKEKGTEPAYQDPEASFKNHNGGQATRRRSGQGEEPSGVESDHTQEDNGDIDNESIRETIEDGHLKTASNSAADEGFWEDDEEPRKNGRLDIDIITAEAMTLAQKLATGETTRHQVIDDGFNRYSFRDRDGLPDWFLDDESKHSKPNKPITAAGAAAIKEKIRALNARPIKKVREAKERKRYKAAKRLEKLRKKSALLADDTDMTEKDKAQMITKMMSKAARRQPKREVKVVVAQGGNRGIKGRPRGVKGRYKIVDARLKKDARAEKRLAKKSK